MQVQGTDSTVPLSSRYSGPLDCAVKTVNSEGVRKSSALLQPNLRYTFELMGKPFQVKGIFRGGFATLLRESLGNAVFFSVYEYTRYHMHSQLKSTSSDRSNLVDVGVGIMSGGLGGIAVSCVFTPQHFPENKI